MTSMKTPGRIVRFRLAPKDCLSVIDVVAQLGLKAERMSFDQACRIALTSVLRSLRATSAIPTRDGYEYGEMMEPFESVSRVDAQLRGEVAERLNAEMFSTEPEKRDARIDHILRRQQEIKDKCTLDPTNHPDRDDYLDYEDLTRQLFEAQGQDCPLAGDDLKEYVRECLPKRID